MARLNVDYRRLRGDYRFKALIKRVGEGEAWERLLRFWDSAQEFWGKEKSLVPAKAFDLEGDLEVLIEVDLAERRTDGIYARGAEEHFDWYLQKCRASRAGVAAKRSKREPLGRPSGEPIGEPNSVNLEVNPPALAPALAPALEDSLAKARESQSGSDWRPPASGFSPGVLVEIWNANRGPLPGAAKLNAERGRKIRARWAEEPSDEYWAGVVRRMAASRFCREGGWATLDWLVKNSTNHTKVAAGNYDNADSSAMDEARRANRKAEIDAAIEREEAKRRARESI